MRKNKNTSKIILAVVVAGLATMISYTVFSNMRSELAGKEQLLELMQNTKGQNPSGENYAYAVATKDLKAGELVADGDVDFKPFPMEDATAFDNRSDVINKVLLQDITIGSTFTTTHIAKISNDGGSTELKSGYRSLTLPAESFQGRSSKMTVGTSVDIFSSSQDDNWSLDNIKILSFEGAAADKPATSITDATAIDFEVPADSIAGFISSVSKSKLVLVARNPNDKQITVRKKPSYNAGGSYGKAMSSLPNLPSTVPIENLPTGGDVSGLPLPIKPSAPPQEVEMIEANVKSKVTFD